MSLLSERDRRACEFHGGDFSDLPALFLGCTLEPSPALLLHLARMLRDRGGVPAHGNQRAAWDAGCRFDHPDPEYR